MTKLVFGSVPRLAAALMLAAGVAVVPMGAQAHDGPAGPSGSADVLQVVADITLIDGTCSHVLVNFGVVFRFAAQRGLEMSAIMPSGSQRDDFERILRTREAGFDHGELCGQVAENYAEALPGSITDLSSRAMGRP